MLWTLCSEGMKFQRDSEAPWRHVLRLVKCLGMSLWKQDAAQHIGLADALRGIGASQLSLSLLAAIDTTRLEVGQLARLRLVRATALQYAGAHREARALFELSERDAPSDVFLSFVLQHHGKCLVEAGELESARGKIEQALSLRRAHGESELVASSERALEALEKLG